MSDTLLCTLLSKTRRHNALVEIPLARYMIERNGLSATQEAERRAGDARSDTLRVELQRAKASHTKMKADATERERCLSKIQNILNDRKKTAIDLKAKVLRLNSCLECGGGIYADFVSNRSGPGLCDVNLRDVVSRRNSSRAGKCCSLLQERNSCDAAVGNCAARL